MSWFTVVVNKFSVITAPTGVFDLDVKFLFEAKIYAQGCINISKDISIIFRGLHCLPRAVRSLHVL